MARFEIESGGKRYEVEAPTQEAALSLFNKPQERSLTGFGSNALTSGGHLVTGLAHAAMHPIDTLSTMGDIAYGAAQHATGEHSTTESAKRARDTASAVAEFYRNRYGGWDKTLDTLYTDPVGALADVALGATGIGGAARLGATASRVAQLPRAAAALEPVANAAGFVAKADPVMFSARMLPRAVGGLGSAAASVLGKTTGRGSEAVEQGFKSGLMGGGSSGVDYWRATHGNLDPASPGVKADAALKKYTDALNTEYGREVAPIEAVNPSFAPGVARNAFDEAVRRSTLETPHTGGAMETLVEGQAATAQKVRGLLDAFIQNPNLHNYQGAQRIKQAIGGLWNDAQGFEKSNAIVQMAKDLIDKELTMPKAGDLPHVAEARAKLAAANAKYAPLKQEVRQWENMLKTFGTDDAQFRAMLGAESGNPANALRAKQFTDFQSKAGVDLSSGLQGMQMQSLAGPYAHMAIPGIAGLGGVAAGHAGLGALALPALAASSPRLVGTGAYVAGRLASLIGQLGPTHVANLLRKLPPQQAQALLQALDVSGDLAYQSSRGTASPPALPYSQQQQPLAQQ